MTERDRELGAALRDLPAPDHDPAFFAELRGQLAEVEQVRRPARSRRIALRLVTAAAVAAAVLAVISSRDGSGPSPRLGTPAATAAEVRATALRAWANLRSLSGRALVRRRIAATEPVQRERFDFWTTARGDLRTRGPGARQSGYDPATGTEVIVGDPMLDGKPYLRRGLAPAAPDAHPSEELLQRGLAAVVRALRESGGGSVRQIRSGGRPAWLLRTRVPVNKLGFSADMLEVVVDRASGLPLRARETYKGRLVSDLQLSRLRADAAPPFAAPRLGSGPAGLTTNDGFRRVPADAVQAAAGYAPLVPGWVPDGFARAETVVAPDAQPTGMEGMNPRSRDVVSAVWRRGLDRLVVTTRRVGSSPRSWEDPLSPPEGYLAKPQRVRLGSGALAGVPADVLVDPRATPHVWARTPQLVVTVSGDLTRAELLRVAESLGR
jgi:hypothetical protein